MAGQVRKALLKIILFLSLLFLGGLMDILGRNAAQVTAVIYYLVLAVIYEGRISDRIVDGRVRKFLAGSAWMAVLLFLLRGLKYHVFREFDVAGRWLWYLYYLPNLMFPMLSLLAALAADGTKEKRGTPGRVILHGITATLLLMVLTNDLHQLVFRFQPHFENWDWDYQHGPVYPIIAAWILFLFVAAVFVMVKRCRLSAGKSLFWIPLLPIGFGVAYAFLYVFNVVLKWEGINVIEFPELACFVVACFWECCITIGLIPSNEGYEELFTNSKVAAQIVDGGTNVKYRSATAANLSPEQKEAKRDLMLDEDTWLHCAPIQGGLVYWQSDVSEPNRLNRELERLEERLSEETELIRLQNDMKIERAKIAEKNRVYDEIAARVHKQSRKIAALAEEAEKDGECFEGNIARICFYGTYIKRYANLMLLQENSLAGEKDGEDQDGITPREVENRELPGKELELAVSELLRALSACGIPVSQSGSLEGMFSPESILRVYEWLEGTLEAGFEALAGVYVRFQDQSCKVMLEGRPEGPVLMVDFEEAAQDLRRVGVFCKVTKEDAENYVRFDFIKGGMTE